VRSVLALGPLVVASILALAPDAGAVDTPLGEPGYLGKEIGPKWRLGGLPVVLIEEERTSLRESLDLLERQYDLAALAPTPAQGAPQVRKRAHRLGDRREMRPGRLRSQGGGERLALRVVRIGRGRWPAVLAESVPLRVFPGS
jgi:hypothetical protein